MTTQTRSENLVRILSNHGFANLWFNLSTRHHSLHAAVPFDTNDILIDFRAGSIQRHPTYLTVQTGEDVHITLEPMFLQYINHSCEPNVFFDTTAMQLVCIRPIRANDELCFFYPSTEWEMAQPFICNCGSSKCLHVIKGAAHLAEEILGQYRLTDFIRNKINQER